MYIYIHSYINVYMFDSTYILVCISKYMLSMKMMLVIFLEAIGYLLFVRFLQTWWSPCCHAHS